LTVVTDVTRILSSIERGDRQAAEQLLPLVYDELRKLAAQRLAQEKPGQTLQPTALVHEAYLRLTDRDESVHWNGRGHFFAAAAEAMRRILIENARRKGRVRHGGGAQRLDLDQMSIATDGYPDELLALNDALDRLEAVDAAAAQLVKLRFFAGLTMPQAADALGIPLRTAERNWTYARAWLHRALSQEK
jgi:RNA polymerase sigma factor (TIGR02999 family)